LVNRQLLGEMEGIDTLLQQLAVSQSLRQWQSTFVQAPDLYWHSQASTKIIG
jgi:hypothetical protein